MVLTELKKKLQKRQNELISLLENKSAEFEIEKQHQVYGAINELNVVLETLNYYRNMELKSNNNGLSELNSETFKNTDSKDKDISESGLFFNIKEKIFRNFKKITRR
ncbi:hypothetical protein GF327_04490 [Candidatus Woesearchaeota archaeon]|nr:hypothetical protein [Candidatus Woesearchaeota archaeon]